MSRQKFPYNHKINNNIIIIYLTRGYNAQTNEKWTSCSMYQKMLDCSDNSKNTFCKQSKMNDISHTICNHSFAATVMGVVKTNIELP